MHVYKITQTRSQAPAQRPTQPDIVGYIDDVIFEIEKTSTSCTLHPTTPNLTIALKKGCLYIQG